MKSFIQHIGVVDHSNVVHAVTFGPGVNVVTGKSSTGKSALIEILDFCFGSSDFTVPEGVITANAQIYFVVVCIHEKNLVLARKRDGSRAFIKYEPGSTELSTFRQEYFANDYFIPLDDFIRELGRWFGLRTTDVDESLEDKVRRGGRKSPAPSARSFASFMLQHQNLIANKHAIFYRFDEKEKREQAIEHFRIFVGFVEQTYFVKLKRLNELKSDLRAIEQQMPRASSLKEKAKTTIANAVDEYVAISGMRPDIGDISEAVKNPRRVLDALKSSTTTLVALSDEHIAIKERLEGQRSEINAELRAKQQKLSALRSSIKFAKTYTEQAEGILVPHHAELLASECPFCHSYHPSVEREANRLSDAIEWLNEELARSAYRLESFEEEEAKLEREISTIRQNVQACDDRLAAIDNQIAELQRYKSQHELAIKAKVRIELTLEQLLEKPEQNLEDQLIKIKREITEITTYLNEKYDVDTKLRDAEKRINAIMGQLGNRFEFEESYRPIDLRFSLDTFDLWHQSKDRRVFLRSMGSGANWLYCHLTLFLSLQRYFCTLGDSCVIPTIIFLDQPSQVYFPSVLDTGEKFSPEELATKEGQARKRPLDDDIRAVTNLYSQLVWFCEDTLKETGILPQIIVTDHADNLTLANGEPFETLVQGRRWRNRGFIVLPPESPKAGGSSPQGENELPTDNTTLPNLAGEAAATSESEKGAEHRIEESSSNAVANSTTDEPASDSNDP